MIAQAEHRKTPWPEWPTFGEREKQSLIRVIESNQLFAADEVRAFEQEFAAHTGSKYAKGVGNATQGLHLALAALDVGVGDEVIVTPYSWISSSSCVLMQNAVPIFADCDPQTLALSPQAVEASVTDRTKAIILVHMFGYIADVAGIAAIAKHHNLKFIEDASHAHGANLDGKRAGTFGDIGVFSLHQRKTLPVGDGGMVITDQPDIDERIYRLRSFGHNELSYNYRMTEFAAALGRVRLTDLDGENKQRAANADVIRQCLENIPGLSTITPLPKTQPVYYRVLLDFDPNQHSIDLTQLIEKLNLLNYPFERTWMPLHRHPHFNPEHVPARGCPWQWPLYEGSMRKHAGYGSLNFPIVEDFCDNRGFELSVHPPVSTTDVREAMQALIAVATEHAR